MRRLFLKTFLWFWLTVILAVLAALLPSVYSQRLSQSKWNAVVPTLMPRASREAVDIFESSGEWALLQYLGQLQREFSVEGFLFRDDQEVLGPRLDPELARRRAAQIAERQPGPYVRGLEAAQRVTGASGRTYALVLAYRDFQGNRYFALEVPLVLLLAGGLFCFLITRHVTSPLFKLRAAAASIAEGRLDTRVGPELGHRSDEIADLARDFDRMAERIESLLAGQKRLLGDVSHELRSPLARLTVALSLAQHGPAADAPEHLERIQLEARRLDKLIGQLLMLSRIDSGVQGVERGSIDLGALVQEAASDADFEARARSRRVTVEHSDACSITGSEEILRSAVENVLRNAVRHTGEGTAVEVALRRNLSKAVLSVRDHGAGVRESMLSEMFLPFRRAPEMNSKGAGLGLAITERAVRAHGGAVRAANVPEGGLLVEMEFPLA
jgi:two-component system, OmpR family, sensor histidine kinase CpxA